MTRYRMKPVYVEAWEVGSDEPIPKWLDGYINYKGRGDYGLKMSSTSLHSVRVSTGDYIVLDGYGSRRRMRKSYFEQRYEVCDD